MDKEEALGRYKKALEKYGIEPKGETYETILAEELTPEICRSFSDCRERVMALAWYYLKQEGVETFEKAMEKAWDSVEKECKELGVPGNEIGGEFPKPKGAEGKPAPKKKEFEIQVPKKSSSSSPDEPRPKPKKSKESEMLKKIEEMIEDLEE